MCVKSCKADPSRQDRRLVEYFQDLFPNSDGELEEGAKKGKKEGLLLLRLDWDEQRIGMCRLDKILKACVNNDGRFSSSNLVLKKTAKSNKVGCCSQDKN